jgi:hypothetical protein
MGIGLEQVLICVIVVRKKVLFLEQKRGGK